MVELVTTDSLSPNSMELSFKGTPRYCRSMRNDVICCMAVLAAENSDPYVAVSTVACFLEYQLIGVWFT